jgi:hypothetical protein
LAHAWTAAHCFHLVGAGTIVLLEALEGPIGRNGGLARRRKLARVARGLTIA